MAFLGSLVVSSCVREFFDIIPSTLNDALVLNECDVHEVSITCWAHPVLERSSHCAVGGKRDAGACWLVSQLVSCIHLSVPSLPLYSMR